MNKESIARISKATVHLRIKPYSPLNELFGEYRRAAKKRSMDFDLSESRFRELVSAICFYCGTDPRRRTTKTSRRDNHGILVNGIDRLDNSIGYVESNVVTCCKTCNIAKGTMAADVFIAWIHKASRHLGVCAT